MKKSNIRRSHALGLSSAILCVVLLALVLLNLVIGAASSRILLTWDLTHNQIFALSQQTKDLLSALSQDVAIDVMCDELQLENSGGYFTQAKKVIDQYSIYGHTVTVTYRDPAANPGFVSQYSEFSPQQYDILVSSGSKTIKTNVFDLFNSQQGNQPGKQFIQSSKAEQQITSSILRVTSDRVVHAVILTGQEGAYPKALESLLVSNGYEVTQQNLSVGTIPEDAEVLFLLAPTRDLSEDAVNTLQKYLENNGTYGHTLVYAPSVDTPVLPNLEAFLLQWGVSYAPSLVMESDSQRYINSSPYLSVVEYVPGEDVPDYRADVPYLNPFGREMHRVFDAQSGYSTQVLLQYSEKAYAMPLTAQEGWKPGKDDFAAFPALIRSRLTQHTDSGEKYSTVLAFSSAEELGQTALENVTFSNSQYLMELLGDACNREESIHIPAKTIQNDRLAITQAQFSALTFLFTILLPAAVLLIGLAVWLHRRKL